MVILQNNPALNQIVEPSRYTVLHVATRACYITNNSYGSSKLKKKVLKENNLIRATTFPVSIKNGHLQMVEADDKMNVMPSLHFQKRASTFRRRNSIADIEMADAKKELMTGVSRRVVVRWNKLYLAVNKGVVDPNVIVVGLMRDGKELLRHQDQETGETLLHAAVKAVGLTIRPLNQLVKFMITNNLTDAALLGNKHGDTALHMALQLGHTEACRLLVKATPWAVYRQNYKGVSPFYLALKAGKYDIVEYMMRMVSRSCARKMLLIPNKHATLAHRAIKDRCLGTLRILMEHLPELINETDEKGWRPLSYAAYKGYLNEVTYFLASFPESVEKYDRDGSLPIHKAVGGGHVSIIQAFVSYCPQALYHVNRKGRSVLHVAVRYGRDENLAYLMKEIQFDKSFLNLRDNDGKTFMNYRNQPKL